MIEKWSVAPAPSSKDPERQELRLQAEMKDVLEIVKKFGALCGRPARVNGKDGHNFKMYLHAPSAAKLELVASFLNERIPVKESPAPEPPAAPAAPTPPPAAAPAAPAGIATTPAAPRPAKPLWGVAATLETKRDFDALLVGSFNRFAHAAATSVVGSPGSMYNPLFIHGSPGVGKTHMLHAIGCGLAKAMTPDALVLTSGARLTGAVNAALAAGKFEDLERFMADKKVFLVDDAHLLAVSEANQAALAKIFTLFFGRNQQVVFTSLYPPRALGAMEEALKISLGRGWAVDMKIPSVETQKDMIVAAFARAGVDLTNEEAALFHERLGSNYAEAARWMRRLLAFKKLRAAAQDVDALLNELFAAAVETGELPSAADFESARSFSPPAPGLSAQNLALFVPKGQEAMGPWILSRFYDAAAKADLKFTYRHVLFESYDSEQPFGAPFQIGEQCQRAGAEAALVLGPTSASKLSERVVEFSHAVGHVLEGLDAAMGWIPHGGTMAAPYFLWAHLDFQGRSFLK